MSDNGENKMEEGEEDGLAWDVKRSNDGCVPPEAKRMKFNDERMEISAKEDGDASTLMREPERDGGDDFNYGGLEGPNSTYVKLVASDGHEFVLRRDLALRSKTIEMMVNGPGRAVEGEVNEVGLRNIPSHILEILPRYMSYMDYYGRTRDIEGRADIDIPPFPIEPEMSLELLSASVFLQL